MSIHFCKKKCLCTRFEFVFANDKEICKASNAGQRKVYSKTLSLYDFCIEVFTVKSKHDCRSTENLFIVPIKNDVILVSYWSI